MQTAPHYKSRIFLLKLIFPLIYAGFFVVQLFINFDTAFTRTPDRYQFIQSHSAAGSSVALNKSGANRPVKTRFRLNKRFQPAFISIPPNTGSSPVIESVAIQRIAYSSPFIANPLRDCASRRGPPAVV
jgi:hypothetical protein